MEIKIVIPSHKRADRVMTTKIVESIICIPESQLNLYKESNPGAELVTHPDSVVGLAAKRNWIYKHFKSVMMLDDDIVGFRRLYVGAGIENEIGPKHTKAIIEETAYAAKQAGAYLFGFNHICNPTMYSGFKPIQLTGYVTGCATGMLEGSKLWFNPEIICNEDYWISALNAYHHRKIWKDMRFTFIQKDTFVSAGGLAEFRNIDAERKDFELLQKCFGKDIIAAKPDTRMAKRKHEFQKTLKLPF